jgi:hypothetical protein
MMKVLKDSIKLIENTLENTLENQIGRKMKFHLSSFIKTS